MRREPVWGHLISCRLVTPRGDGDEPERPKGSEIRTRLTTDEFRLLTKIAQARGESVSEVVRSFVLSTIDDVMKELEKE